MHARTTHFREISLTPTRRGKCPACGKPTVRTQKFFETVNPYNRAEDGTPKTPDQIFASVREKAENWVPDFRHERCKPEDA